MVVSGDCAHHVLESVSDIPKDFVGSVDFDLTMLSKLQLVISVYSQVLLQLCFFYLVKVTICGVHIVVLLLVVSS